MPLAPWEEPAVVAQALASLAAQQPAPQRLVLSVDGPLPAALQQVVQAQVMARLPILVLPGPGGEGVGVVLARGLEEVRERAGGAAAGRRRDRAGTPRSDAAALLQRRPGRGPRRGGDGAQGRAGRCDR